MANIEKVLDLSELILELRKEQEQNLAEVDRVLTKLESVGQKLRHYTWLLENELEGGGEENEVKQHPRPEAVKGYQHPRP